MDVVIITPEPGRHKDIGQRLLALADKPSDVQWVTWPQAGFKVPLGLFEKFDTDSDSEEAPEAPKRRRGRPRKEETSTDNNTSEEE